MSEKYKGLVGRAHLAKESAKEAWSSAKEVGGVNGALQEKVDQYKENVIRKINHGEGDYDHLYRYNAQCDFKKHS